MPPMVLMYRAMISSAVWAESGMAQSARAAKPRSTFRMVMASLRSVFLMRRITYPPMRRASSYGDGGVLLCLPGVQVAVEPCHPPIEPILEEGRIGQPMELPRIDDELGRHPQLPQSLIHLLPADDRDIEIGLAAHEERGRLDPVRPEERVGEFDPEVPGLPRRPQLQLVLGDVLIGPVHRELQRTARAADRGLEACGGRDGVVGENPAVTPAADAQPS